MSENIFLIVQVVIALFVFSFSAQWLVKITKNPLLAASLLAAFLLIWTDSGGLSQVEKIGAFEFIKRLILDIFAFGFFFFIAYIFTNTQDDSK